MPAKLLTPRPLPAAPLALVWAGVAVAIAAFFLPWARLDINTQVLDKEIGGGIRRGLSKSFGIKGQREPSWIRNKKKSGSLVPSRMSGAQIPRYANSKQAGAALQLVRVFTKKDERVGLKSYAVFLVPGLALLCGIVLANWGGYRAVCASVAVLCAFVAGSGCWSLLTTDTRKAYAVAIDIGLWLSLGAYAWLAFVAALASLPQAVRRRLPLAPWLRV